MSRRNKAPGPAAALALPPELTIYTVRELHPQWLAWLAQVSAGADEMAPVHGAEVGEIDAAGMQMLLSLQRALAERGRRLQLQSPSRALQAGCHAAGLGDWLPAPGAAEGTA